MKTTRKVMKEVEEHDYVCDRCEASMRVQTGHGNGEIHGIVGGTEVGGYFSEFPPDCERWTFDLCEGCTAWLASEMKRYPCVGRMNLGTGTTFPEPPVEQTKRAIETGDFSELMKYPMGTVACLRALARRQTDAEAFAAIDNAATAAEAVFVRTYNDVRNLWCEAKNYWHGLFYPANVPDDPETRRAEAARLMPALGTKLYHARIALQFVADSPDVPADIREHIEQTLKLIV